MELTLFDDKVGYDLSRKIFLDSELGLLWQSIPFEKLAVRFQCGKNKYPQGRRSRFTIAGGLGLMFLKHYLGLSDRQLKQRVNCDWQLQMFCGVVIDKLNPIKDDDIVGRWRRFFAERMTIEDLQSDLIDHWKEHMNQLHILMNDATCYESYIKFPTDTKLLWDCSQWLFDLIDHLCKTHQIKKPRTKYKDQKTRQLNFQKLKKKSRKKERRRRRQLLYWVGRGLGLLQGLLDQYPIVHTGLKEGSYDRIKIIRVILVQQRQHFDQPGARIPHRIVSLFKPYLRPIVRGKENKRVEFGAKVHTSQVDQINFIEHLSFEAFHEGVRMYKSLWKHNKMFGSKCKQYAADKLYASNKNRRHCRVRDIHTCFIKKGRAGKDEHQKEALRKGLNNARATLLEGSFGNEKNHYLLRKIKARKQNTEIAWIFFGIHTANAIKISRRISKKTRKYNTSKDPPIQLALAC